MTNRFDLGYESTAQKAIRKHMERIDKLVNSPAIEAIRKHQESLSKLIDSPVLKEMREHEERINRIYQSPALTAMIETENRWKSLVDSPTIAAFKKQEKRINEIYNSPALVAIRAQEEKFRGVFDSPASKALRESAERFEKLYSSPITKAFEEHERKWKGLFKSSTFEALNIARDISASGLVSELNIDDLSFKDTFDLVGELYEEEGAKQYISFEGYIQILLAIMLYLAAYSASMESDSEIIGRIDKLEVQISSQIENINQEENEGTFYIVERAVKLRSENHTGKEAVVIDVLYPNQRVKLLKRDKKWIYVSFYDYLAGVQRNGWVYKKHLAMEK